MEKFRTNLWNKSQENFMYQKEVDYLSHLQNLRKSKLLIDTNIPFQPDHIQKLRYYDKCGYKREQDHIQFINTNLVQRINDVQKNNNKYNKDHLQKRFVSKTSLNFENRKNQQNQNMANMINTCKPSVNNVFINKQYKQNLSYKNNILKNSKRIYNPHLKVHQTGIKSLNLYEYQQFRRSSVKNIDLTKTFQKNRSIKTSASPKSERSQYYDSVEHSNKVKLNKLENMPEFINNCEKVPQKDSSNNQQQSSNIINNTSDKI